MDLTDAQWAFLAPTFRPRVRPDGRGRPWTDARAVLNGVLWVLRTGAPWHDRSQRGRRRRHLRRGQKRGPAVGPTRRGKGSKIMAICDRHGLPLAVHVASASPAESHLVTATLKARFVRALPTRLIGDKGYDSDPLDTQLRRDYGIEMIARNRRGRR